MFNFGDADPEFGQMQGKELQNTLGSVLAAFPVVVRTGKGYVEACHQDVNKGAMAARIIDLLRADAETFVFCVGDVRRAPSPSPTPTPSTPPRPHPTPHPIPHPTPTLALTPSLFLP